MRRWIACFATLALLLAACGEGEEPEAQEEPEAATEEEDAFDEADLATVLTAETDFGEVLVDPEGRSLYVFENDVDGESTCYDECAENWPPLITAVAPYAYGAVQADLLDHHTRQDGASQVVYHDWPLYYFAGDSEEGDTNGQGVGGVWWLISPTGEPIRDADS